MSQSAAECLRVVNQNLRAGLARLQHHPQQFSTDASTSSAALLAELLRARDCLCARAATSSPDPDFEAEISAYRNHLEQLAHVLPAVSGRLLTEKARLEAAQAHIARAAAWAQASHKTL